MTTIDLDKWIEKNPRVRGVFIERWREELAQMTEDEKFDVMMELMNKDDETSAVKLNIALNSGYLKDKNCSRKLIYCGGVV